MIHRGRGVESQKKTRAFDEIYPPDTANVTRNEGQMAFVAAVDGLDFMTFWVDKMLLPHIIILHI